MGNPVQGMRQVAPAENVVMEMEGPAHPPVMGEQVVKEYVPPPPPVMQMPPIVTTAAPVYAQRPVQTIAAAPVVQTMAAAPVVTTYGTTAQPVTAAPAMTLLAADLNHDGVIESNEVFAAAPVQYVAQ